MLDQRRFEREGATYEERDRVLLPFVHDVGLAFEEFAVRVRSVQGAVRANIGRFREM